MHLLIPLIAAILPFVLWPVELLLPFPYIIEEAVKAILVLFIIDRPEKPIQLKIALASAVTFALSETVLYILNISFAGDISTLITRLALTTILHSLTITVILISTFRFKQGIFAGLGLAMLIHYLYNAAI